MPARRRGLRPVLTGVCLAALALSGCGDGERAGDGVRLQTSDWEPGDVTFASALRGRLGLEAGGCVTMQSPDGVLATAWPKGWSADRRDGVLRIRRGDGSVAATEGDQLDVRGIVSEGAGCAGRGTAVIQDELRG